MGYAKVNRGSAEVLVQKVSQEEKAIMVEYYTSMHIMDYLDREKQKMFWRQC